MRYLIVGCGRVGSALAKLLDSDGHEVIVVDENAAAFKRLGSEIQRPRSRRHRHRLRRPQTRRRGDRRRLCRRHQRRQPQHHGRPDRPAHVQHQEDRRTHLRSAARTNVSRAGRADRLPDDGRSKDDPRHAHCGRRDRSTVRLREVDLGFGHCRRGTRRKADRRDSRNRAAFASRRSVAAAAIR